MEKIDTDTTSATHRKKRNHYVFQCITLNPEQRPNGKRITEGCGRWCVYSSPKELRYLNSKGEQEILQGYCSNHPENTTGNRKQRLNEDRLDIHTYSTRKDAQNAVDLKNGVKQPPQPKGEPQGLSQRKIVVPAPLGQTSDEPEPVWTEDELKYSGLI